MNDYIFTREQYGNDPSFSIEVEDLALDFFLTCMACPEQYDVFIGDKQVGYVRLRGGYLRAAYPDVDGKYSFNYHFAGDPWKGGFDSESERKHYLYLVAEHLVTKYRLDR